MKELRKYGTVVFIDSSEMKNLPASIKREVFKAAKSGGGAVPFGVVMNVSHTKTYGSFNYKGMINQKWKEAFGDIKQKISDAKKTGELKLEKKEVANDDNAPADTQKDSPKSDYTDRKFLNWNNAQGKKVVAKFIKLNGTKVSFMIKSGKIIDYPLGQLSEASQVLAKSLGEQYAQ